MIWAQQVAECPSGDTWMEVVFLSVLVVCVTVCYVAYRLTGGDCDDDE